MRREFFSWTTTLVASLVISACVATDVGPINTAGSLAPPPTPEFIPDAGDDGSLVVGLAFSGGGMRASAFSYGVLRALDDIVIDEKPYRRTVVDDVRVLAGVSGGAITAAYFGYRGRDEYRDFYDRFLLRNPEESMRTSRYSPVALSRALHGGVNDRGSFGEWMDRNLFDGATFHNLRRPNAPAIWINASDIYNRTPFLFSYDTFAALCSDLDAVKIADAVAASAAFPVVFAPVTLETRKRNCAYSRPEWLTKALGQREASVRLRAYARSLDAYHASPSLRYVRLLDGGLTDNLGVTGFVLERAAARTPYGPLSAEEAVKLRYFLFLIADAGRDQEADWGDGKFGPQIAPLLQAVVDTNMSSAVRDQVDALDFATQEWEEQLKRYRCSLPASTVRRIRGTLSGWDCRRVGVVVRRLSFADLDPATRERINLVPTRLSLPREQVDDVVAAGRATVHRNATIMRIVSEIGGRAGVREPLVLAGK